MKVLLENLLRFEDGKTVTVEDIQALVDWQETRSSEREIQYRPARVLMQDFTGVPAVVDLAAMRDAMAKLGGDPQKINPLVPVHLVIDHSVMVDEFGTPKAFEANVALEYQRNIERYQFLKWGAVAFDNFQVVPPGTGICHQVNLEYIARGVWSTPEVGGDAVGPTARDGAGRRPTGGRRSPRRRDRLSGHAGRHRQPHHHGQRPRRARLGRRRDRGRGGDARPAGLDDHPRSGRLPPDRRAQGRDHRHRSRPHRHPDAARQGRGRALRRVLRPRRLGAVGRRPGDDRQHGARIWRDLRLLPDRCTRRSNICASPAGPRRTIALTEAYCKAQGMWLDEGADDPVFTETLRLDMSTVEPSLAGPKRPQDKVLLSQVDEEFRANFTKEYGHPEAELPARFDVEAPNADGAKHDIGHGDVVIAAITSCTNTSNPSVLVAAGLVARKARALGLDSKPWVKTSLAPGSQVVTDYLDRAGPYRGSQRDRLRSGRLWLHHLHRQFGAAARGDQRLDPQERRRRRLGPLRQPQFRGAGLARRARQLSRLAAARRRLCAEGHGGPGHGRRRRSARTENGNDVFLKDIWPSNDEIREPDRPVRQRRHVPRRAMPTSTRATRAGRGSRSPAATPMAGRRAPPTSPIRLISRA